MNTTTVNTEKTIGLAFSPDEDNKKLAEKFIQGGLVQPIEVDIYKYLGDMGVKSIKDDYCVGGVLPSKEDQSKAYNKDVRTYLVGYLVMGGMPLDIVNEMIYGFTESLVEYEVDGVGGYYKSAQIHYAVKMLNNFLADEFHGFFKMIYGNENNNLNTNRKIFCECFGLTKKKYIKYIRNVFNNTEARKCIRYNKDNSVFFIFKSGRMLEGDFSSMYVRGFMKGYKLFKQVWECSAIGYIKSIDMGVHGITDIQRKFIPKQKKLK